MKPKPETRFEILHRESISAHFMTIFKDKHTGVLYLSNWSGDSGGITPLLDSEGKPIIELNNNTSQ